MENTTEEITSVIDNLRRIFQAITEYSKNAKRSTGLTGSQLWALKLLANSPPIRVSELARQMHLCPATVVGILDKLEENRLITRTRSQEDRRAVNLHITAQGKRVVAESPEIAQAMLLKGLGELSHNEFIVVAEGMQQMARILQAEHITPQPLHS